MKISFPNGIRTLLSYKWLWLSILSAVLLNLSQAPFDVGVVRWVALVPILFIIYEQKLSIIRKAMLIWLMGAVYLLWHFSVILHMAPLDWLGIESAAVGLSVIALVWFFSGISISVAYVTIVVSQYALFLFPFVFTVQEYVRAVLYSIVVLADSSYIGDNFSLGYIAYSVHTNDIAMYVAPALGIYGLTFVIVGVNVIVFTVIRNWNRFSNVGKKIFVLMALALVIAEFIPTAPYKREEGENTVEVVVAQADNPALFGYPHTYFSGIAAAYTDTVRDALSAYPNTDIVVLPENAQIIRTLSYDWRIPPAEVAANILGEDKYRLLVYGDYDKVQNVSMAATISNDPNEREIRMEKSILMPLGEYQPGIIAFLAKVVNKTWYQQISRIRNVTIPRGDIVKKIDTRVGDISIVACSEILSLDVYQKIAKEGPDFIIHQQRLATSHGRTKLFYQMLAVAKVRAAILKKYIIGSIDSSGYSYVIDPKGKVVVMGGKDTTFIHALISF